MAPEETNSKQPLPSNPGEPTGPTGPSAQDEPSGPHSRGHWHRTQSLGKDAPPRRGTRSVGAPFPSLGLWTKWGLTGCLVRTSRESCSRQRPCPCAGGQGPRPPVGLTRGTEQADQMKWGPPAPMCVCPLTWGPPCVPRVLPGTDPVGVSNPPAQQRLPPAPLHAYTHPGTSGNQHSDDVPGYHELLSKGPLLGLDTWSEVLGAPLPLRVAGKAP